MRNELYFPGLEGVIAGETALSTIEDGLRYRGYSIDELARSGTFIETAYLLLYGELPTDEELADFRAVVADSAEVDEALKRFLTEIPLHVPLMDVLRTGISALGHFDPQPDDESHTANLGRAIRLLAQIPVLIGHRYRFTRDLPPVEPDPTMGFAGNLLMQVTGDEPTPLQERALDVSLILYAEHEFNASTFTARVVASTLSDLYSAMTAAVGALKGPLHGGANERVLEMLQAIDSPDDADRWVRDALARKQRLMGFGHRVYKTGDPRSVLLREYCVQLADETGNNQMEEIAETIERIVWNEKQLPPNLDWPSARLYYYLGLESELYTPFFVASRVVGWAAHCLEQWMHNRLIRPRSRYNGPPARPFVPISKRG